VERRHAIYVNLLYVCTPACLLIRSIIRLTGRCVQFPGISYYLSREVEGLKSVNLRVAVFNVSQLSMFYLHIKNFGQSGMSN
jgi:hypothetical protein